MTVQEAEDPPRQGSRMARLSIQSRTMDLRQEDVHLARIAQAIHVDRLLYEGKRSAFAPLRDRRQQVSNAGAKLPSDVLSHVQGKGGNSARKEHPGKRAAPRRGQSAPAPEGASTGAEIPAAEPSDKPAPSHKRRAERKPAPTEKPAASKVSAVGTQRPRKSPRSRPVTRTARPNPATDPDCTEVNAVRRKQRSWSVTPPRGPRSRGRPCGSTGDHRSSSLTPACERPIGGVADVNLGGASGALLDNRLATAPRNASAHSARTRLTVQPAQPAPESFPPRKPGALSATSIRASSASRAVLEVVAAGGVRCRHQAAEALDVAGFEHSDALSHPFVLAQDVAGSLAADRVEVRPTRPRAGSSVSHESSELAVHRRARP